MSPKIDWLDPWYPIDDGTGLELELARELTPGHVLFGRRVTAIGRRNGRDDVLFWLPDEGDAVACVHLTWIGKPEQQPVWPWTEIFSSPQEWMREVMFPDHHEEDGPLPRRERS